MKDTIKIVFTTKRYNPISLLIRWALPPSRFSLAKSSHCLIVAGHEYVEANMLHGVINKGALEWHEVVYVAEYQVPNAKAGLDWGRSQIGKRYDWPGAIGLAIAPDRDWQSEESWFCYEFGAGILKNAGLDVFSDTGHITGNTLLSLKHRRLT